MSTQQRVADLLQEHARLQRKAAREMRMFALCNALACLCFLARAILRLT
jgi:hypothetical protein